MSDPDIRVFEWSLHSDQLSSCQHALFNSDALARAGRLNGNNPFCISTDGLDYLVHKRHASAVIGGLSLADMSALLNNMPHVRDKLVPKGIRSLSLSSWNAENNPEVLYQLLNQQCQMRFEFMLDTTQYSINKISSNHKRNIKKSEKARVELVFPVDAVAVRSHIELVNTNLSNKGVGGLTNSPEYFQCLLEQGAGLLVQVKDGDQLLASTFFYMNRDYCYYHSSGTDDRGKQIGAAHFLVDRMIAEMRNREIRYLNLGGCTSEQTGLYRFKLGFRPETRILLSAQRRLVSSGRSKLRSLLSVRPKDILSTTRVQIFINNKVEKSSGIVGDYLFSKLSFNALFNAVSDNPELSRSLFLYCRPSSLCYGLYNNKEQVVAIGFIETSGEDKKIVSQKDSSASELVELAHIYVVRDMRNMGVGRELVAYLEDELLKLGHCRAYSRIDAHNVAAQRLFLARGFSKIGEEKCVSSALMPGKQRIIGKIEI